MAVRDVAGFREMTPGEWARVKEIFQAAVDEPPDDWPKLVEQRCGDDQRLRAEVERLLAAHREAGSFISGSPVVPETVGVTYTQMTGRRVDHYQIGRRIGAGGMGEVYDAHDTELDRTVALKFVVSEDHEAQLRLRREAQHASQLNHPHICTIHEVGTCDGQSYIVMEYVEGQPLTEIIGDHGLPFETSLRYGLQIADALAHAHQRGVIHRDLKSANIVVTPEGRAKVLDFGLARRTAEQPPETAPQSQITAAVTGQVAGTLPYMAPELLRGEPADHRTDIWALGVVLYEMAAGHRPFGGSTGFDTSAAILHDAPQRLPPAVPAALQSIIGRCLAKSPDQRYQTAADVLADLTRVQQALSTRALRMRGLVVAGALAALGLVAIAGLLLRPATRLPGREEWQQLTNFPDSVSQPSVSPDGRMITFVRGPGTFQTEGQVYVKALPNGEPLQLTNDGYRKMSPVFSPNGSQIVYTTIDTRFNWDTWTVPLAGGEPRRWLRNASGLVWLEPHRLLFSEIKSGNHMAVVTADDVRQASRDVYVPEHERGMGHRSYPSPDRRWALVVEMDRQGAWLPCRLVPLDGSSAGRPVGPRGGCTFGGWSPDGRWMYLSSAEGGVYHLWRQRFPDGRPEQLTAGATEEEGVAVAPDGQSIVTAVGLKQRSIHVHDNATDRQLSLEGYAFSPKITRDGTKVLYLRFDNGTSLDRPSELWIADAASGRSQLLFRTVVNAGATTGPGGGSFDISADGRRVVLSALDANGTPRLWLLPVDRSAPARQIPGVAGHQPWFGVEGEIFFASDESNRRFVYRAKEDGTMLRKAASTPGDMIGVSPDGRWLAVWVYGQGTMLFPTTSAERPIRIWGRDARMRWTGDGRTLFLSIASTGGTIYAAGRTYAIPVKPGRMLPDMPANGFASEAQLAKLPGVPIIDAADVAPGSTAETYVFSRETTQRNLYRIPLP